MAYYEKALRKYYNDCAKDYDKMYARRDRVWRRELEALADAMTRSLTDRRVLEIACGTGFWTEIVAKVARQVVAIDSSEKMLAIARKRKPRSINVEYRHGDACALAKVPGIFDAGLSNFWFSHVPKRRIDEFLNGWHKRLGKTAVVFIADNVYVPRIGGRIVTKTGVEDTFKLRQGADGLEHEVLKNYYEYDSLVRLLSPRTRDLEVHEGRRFWWLSYTIP